MSGTKYSRVHPVAPSDEDTYYATKYSSSVFTDEESVDLSDVLGPWTSLPYDERSALSRKQHYSAPLDSRYCHYSSKLKNLEKESSNLPIIPEVGEIKEARRLQLRAEYVFKSQDLSIKPLRAKKTVTFSPAETSDRIQKPRQKKQVASIAEPHSVCRPICCGEADSLASPSDDNYFSPSEDDSSDSSDSCGSSKPSRRRMMHKTFSASDESSDDSSNSCIVSEPPRRQKMVQSEEPPRRQKMMYASPVYYEYKDELQDDELECIDLREYVQRRYKCDWSLDWVGDLIPEDGGRRDESMCRGYASAIAKYL